MILRTFNKPTNVFISGIDFINKPETFSITDDYCTFDVLLNNISGFLIDTCGFVFILSEEEFLEIKDSLDLDDSSDNCLRITNFVGTIDLYMVSPSGEKWLPASIDFSEYLEYQNPPEDDWYEVFLNLEGSYDSVIKVTGAEELIEVYQG